MIVLSMYIIDVALLIWSVFHVEHCYYNKTVHCSLSNVHGRDMSLDVEYGFLGQKNNKKTCLSLCNKGLYYFKMHDIIKPQEICKQTGLVSIVRSLCGCCSVTVC